MPVTTENAVRAKLTGLFVQVEPLFRADTIARYKIQAESQFKGWVTMLEGEKPKETRTMFGSILSPPDYVKNTKGSYSIAWDMLVASHKRGEWSCDLVKAERDANASVDYAKEHFITKQTKKIANATKLRTDRPTIDGMLRYNVLIEGTLTFKYPNNDCFALTMSMIVNHRYSRGYKSFYQFPARFGNVYIAGKRADGRISEKWMSENFK